MRLETERLILRKPEKKDAKAFEEGVDKIAIKDFFISYPLKKGGFNNLMEGCIKEWENKRRYWFILELKDSGKIIGLSGVKNIDYYNKTGYLSSWIFKEYRRKGYLMEAKIKINNFCFNELKLRKLKSEVASFNKPSLNIQRMFGMKLEGVLKKENYNPYLKKFADMNQFALFEEDWKKTRPKLIKHLKEKNKKIK
jgi:RimJ/RimL family protein N-acetyltransferase